MLRCNPSGPTSPWNAMSVLMFKWTLVNPRYVDKPVSASVKETLPISTQQSCTVLHGELKKSILWILRCCRRLVTKASVTRLLSKTKHIQWHSAHQPSRKVSYSVKYGRKVLSHVPPVINYHEIVSPISLHQKVSHRRLCKSKTGRWTVEFR